MDKTLSYDIGGNSLWSDCRCIEQVTHLPQSWYWSTPKLPNSIRIDPHRSCLPKYWSIFGQKSQWLWKWLTVNKIKSDRNDPVYHLWQTNKACDNKLFSKHRNNLVLKGVSEYRYFVPDCNRDQLVKLATHSLNSCLVMIHVQKWLTNQSKHD